MSTEISEEIKEKPNLNIKFKLIPETLEKPFKDLFPSYTEGLVRGEPGGYVMTAAYTEGAQDVYQLEPREDDAWILGFWKSGILHTLFHYFHPLL